MTKAELIELLEPFPDDTEVCVWAPESESPVVDRPIKEIVQRRVSNKTLVSLI